MRHRFLSLSFLAAGFTAIGANAQNLVTDGDMSAKGAWSDSFLNTSSDDYPSVTWGYTADKPEAGEGGALYFMKDAPASTSQYCIYQKVSLKAGEAYEFDAAYKILKMKDCWFEVYVDKNAPEQGADYSSSNQVSFFSVWVNPSSQDGTFLENASANRQFKAEEDGDHYLVIKCGANGGGAYEMLVDNISLSQVERPSASFTENRLEGFAPLAVNFNSETTKVTSWAWEFGDGATSSESDPSHVYTSPGSYTVKLTAKNNIGEVVIEKEDLIRVSAPVSLTAGGVVKGGDMTDKSAWSVSELNTPTGKLPVAIWNDKSHTPIAGKAGALYVEGEANESSTVQYCIYQTVTLQSGMVYTFDAAIRDFSDNLDHCFVEAFISDGEPVNGAEFGSSEGTMIAKFSTWDERNVLRGLDGTFGVNGVVIPYIPESDGEKILTLKFGTSDWENKSFPFRLAVDEISFTAERTKPYTDFVSENNQGFSPLEVTFESTSLFADSYVWDFGDGQTESTTEIFVNHVYEKVGSYNVSLKAINEKGDSTLMKENFVIVAERPALPEGEKLYGGDMQQRAFWYVAKVGAGVTPSLTWNYTEAVPAGGDGGCLRITAEVKNNQSNIAIYQPVTLSADSVYTFDCLFKDYAGDVDHFWAQAYITDQRPNDNNDPMSEDDCIGQLNTWVEGHSAKAYEGSFKARAVKGKNHKDDVCEFRPETTGVYYLVFKAGNTDWEGNIYKFDVLIDNLTLKGSIPVAKPVAEFIILSSEEGNAPLEVEFFNMSENADSYLWDFGDGNTSTEENPVHIYTKGGVFTVSLTAYKGSLSNTVVYEDYVKVTGSGITGITSGNDIRVVTTRSRIIAAGVEEGMSVYSSNGMFIEHVQSVGKVSESSELPSGVYVVVADGRRLKVVLR